MVAARRVARLRITPHLMPQAAVLALIQRLPISHLPHLAQRRRHIALARVERQLVVLRLALLALSLVTAAAIRGGMIQPIRQLALLLALRVAAQVRRQTLQARRLMVAQAARLLVHFLQVRLLLIPAALAVLSALAHTTQLRVAVRLV